MTNLIVTDAQDLEIASPIVELFELTIGTTPAGEAVNTNKLYFHAAKDLDNDQADNDLIFDGNTYITLPILMDDIEKKTGGTMNRPKLTIANVESLIKLGSSFRTQIDDDTWHSEIDGEAVTDVNFKLDHLVGQRLERRRTLEKYTGHDENDDPVTAYEFDREVFIIDRIGSISPIFCELELASPADIGGLRIPNRQVIGKYCPWVYQGQVEGLVKSACHWPVNEQMKQNNENVKYSFYFTTDDEPLVKSTHLNGTDTDAWKGGWQDTSDYETGEYVSNSTEYTVTTSSSSSNSVNINLLSNVNNSKLKAGFTSNLSGNPTIVQVAGTRVTLDSAVSTSNGQSIIFTSPVMYYRATQDSTDIEPIEGSLQWGLVRLYSTWASNVQYTPNTYDSRQSPYVKYADTIWRAIRTNLNVAPGSNDSIWTRGDVCGKLLTSCKIRFQVKPKITGSFYDTDSVPHYDTDTSMTLPFGGFPGSKKFR